MQCCLDLNGWARVRVRVELASVNYRRSIFHEQLPCQGQFALIMDGSEGKSSPKGGATALRGSAKTQGPGQDPARAREF
jgi:hypothetical protein